MLVGNSKALEGRTVWRMALAGIGDADGPSSGVVFLAWSLFWATGIWGASVAHKYAGFPDVSEWMLTGWVLGFGLVRWK